MDNDAGRYRLTVDGREECQYLLDTQTGRISRRHWTANRWQWDEVSPPSDLLKERVEDE